MMRSIVQVARDVYQYAWWTLRFSVLFLMFMIFPQMEEDFCARTNIGVRKRQIIFYARHGMWGVLAFCLIPCLPTWQKLLLAVAVSIHCNLILNTMGFILFSLMVLCFSLPLVISSVVVVSINYAVIPDSHLLVFVLSCWIGSILFYFALVQMLQWIRDSLIDDTESHTETDTESHTETDTEPHAETDTEPHAEADTEPHTDTDCPSNAAQEDE